MAGRAEVSAPRVDGAPVVARGDAHRLGGRPGAAAIRIARAGIERRSSAGSRCSSARARMDGAGRYRCRPPSPRATPARRLGRHGLAAMSSTIVRSRKSRVASRRAQSGGRDRPRRGRLAGLYALDSIDVARFVRITSCPRPRGTSCAVSAGSARRRRISPALDSRGNARERTFLAARLAEVSSRASAPTETIVLDIVEVGRYWFDRLHFVSGRSAMDPQPAASRFSTETVLIASDITWLVHIARISSTRSAASDRRPRR
jgi:hypothetical protein